MITTHDKVMQFELQGFSCSVAYYYDSYVLYIYDVMYVHNMTMQIFIRENPRD